MTARDQRRRSVSSARADVNRSSRCLPRRSSGGNPGGNPGGGRVVRSQARAQITPTVSRDRASRHERQSHRRRRAIQPIAAARNNSPPAQADGDSNPPDQSSPWPSLPAPETVSNTAASNSDSSQTEVADSPDEEGLEGAENLLAFSFEMRFRNDPRRNGNTPIDYHLHAFAMARAARSEWQEGLRIPGRDPGDGDNHDNDSNDKYHVDQSDNNGDDNDNTDYAEPSKGASKKRRGNEMSGSARKRRK